MCICRLQHICDLRGNGHVALITHVYGLLRSRSSPKCLETNVSYCPFFYSARWSPYSLCLDMGVFVWVPLWLVAVGGCAHRCIPLHACVVTAACCLWWLISLCHVVWIPLKLHNIGPTSEKEAHYFYLCVQSKHPLRRFHILGAHLSMVGALEECFPKH